MLFYIQIERRRTRPPPFCRRHYETQENGDVKPLSARNVLDLLFSPEICLKYVSYLIEGDNLFKDVTFPVVVNSLIAVIDMPKTLNKFINLYFFNLH